ncbi:hypothetical protein AQUCO_01000305v1 [Aquilegia coerulea]|uniref:Uncharacterized protein n=1 Tax=Aquilegia coerulea TaxID=218851 RepID=A0A2G5E9B4_AQUCA|nr:hypothetical protein AQUCO_01000305v1 [Aquilegia coerulea]
MELVIASSPLDSGICCWDLESGAEQLRYKSCNSSVHGLICVGGRFLASSQVRDKAASSGSILYWSWNKAQPEVKSFPELINPITSNSCGAFLIGGGSNGDIYYWEVASGRLLKKWHAHYRAVTCLVLSDDESLLVSGSEDGCVRVWNLVDVMSGNREGNSYLHNFSEHTLRVTDVKLGYGGGCGIIISSSEDRTCKVWSTSKGILLRTISFPSIIDAVALDPGEHVFYAGSRDGKIYIAALNAESSSSSSYGLHIIGALSGHSKSVACLALNLDGNLLVSGSVDGTVRIWDTRAQQIIRILMHSKGPVNNVIVVRRALLNPQTSVNAKASKRASLLPPPLHRQIDSEGDDVDLNHMIAPPQASCESRDALCCSYPLMMQQCNELKQEGSVVLKLDHQRSLQMTQEWKKLYEDLYQFCTNEVVDGDETRECKKCRRRQI